MSILTLYGTSYPVQGNSDDNEFLLLRALAEADARGPSASAVRSNNLGGTFTVSETDTTGAIAFTTAEADTAFELVITCASKSGSAAAGSNRVVSYAKTTAGATVTVEVAPGAGTSRTFSWFLFRPPV